VAENWAPRRIFGPERLKKKEVAEENLHNEELHDLSSLSSIIGIIESRMINWVGHVARMGEERTVYRLSVGKPEGKRPLGRPRRRWIDNTEIDLVQTRWGGVDWIGLAKYMEKMESYFLMR
jgi:hypothetical protein